MKKDTFNSIVLDMSCTDEEWDFVSDEEIISRIEEIDYLEKKDRDGRTLLINAAFYGRGNVVRYLLNRGANIYAKDKEAFTALHAGVIANDIETIKVLLEAGADANAKNIFGNTPIMVADLSTNLQAFKILIGFGADPSQKNNCGVSANDMFAYSTDIFEIISSCGTL